MFEKLSRVFFILLGVLSFVVFAVLMVPAYVTWRQSYGEASILIQALGALEMFLLLPGIAPLLLALYFFVVMRDALVNSYGFLIVVLFVFVHYVTTGIAMHSEMRVFLPLHLIELAVALAVIYFHYRRTKRAPRQEVIGG